MNILYLGVPPFPLTSILRDSGCHVVECCKKISVTCLHYYAIDFIVSYRYQYILRKPVIDFVDGKIINLHISLLPYNRGADPNLWSFLEDSPKGVTIHYIDCGVDTGDIIAQKELFFPDKNETLETTYERLSREMIELFKEQWPLVMAGKNKKTSQRDLVGSEHRVKDKSSYSALLAENGWKTRVSDLIGKAKNKTGKM